MLTEDALSYYKTKDETIPIQAIEMRVCSSIKYVDEQEGGMSFFPPPLVSKHKIIAVMLVISLFRAFWI